MKKRKKLHGFSYYKNMANFEAFLQGIKLSAKLLFLKSGCATKQIYLVLSKDRFSVKTQQKEIKVDFMGSLNIRYWQLNGPVKTGIFCSVLDKNNFELFLSKKTKLGQGGERGKFLQLPIYSLLYEIVVERVPTTLRT